jgi:hypothetical protein
LGEALGDAAGDALSFGKLLTLKFFLHRPPINYSCNRLHRSPNIILGLSISNLTAETHELVINNRSDDCCLFMCHRLAENLQNFHQTIVETHEK